MDAYVRHEQVRNGQDGHEGARGDGSVKQLHIKVLVGLFLAAGVLAWSGARVWGSRGPPPSGPGAAPVVLGVVAAAVFLERVCKLPEVEDDHDHRGAPQA